MRKDAKKHLSILSGEQMRNLVSEDDWLEVWEQFYHEVFGIRVNLDGVQIPRYKREFDWVVIVLGRLSFGDVWRVCSEKFSCSPRGHMNLSELVTGNDSVSPYTYAFRMRARREAEGEFRMRSADEFENNTTIMLVERLLLELWFFWRAGGRHLDYKRGTICAGSRFVNGRVPFVYWNLDLDELQIDSCVSHASFHNCAVRQVIR